PAEAFGHGGAAGQVAWADPASGFSFAYLTNGLDRNDLASARRRVALSTRALACVEYQN
ncbi:MAG: beta-lactamase family protein, partial [Acidimicrobiaceae bacterium]|nr:beta-lactamase family protein [Acidimicrobiaceae bacterium]